MKFVYCVILVFCIAFVNLNYSYAQDTAQCKVEAKNLVGTYTGDCKNGYAHGKGEASGFQHYIGMFKRGLPDGKGVYNYSDSIYYSGKFQDGIREGKGEIHYMRSGMADSIIKGYWSGDEYRGDRYITYKFDGQGKFDMFEFTPTAESGNTVTIGITTTSGTPDGTPVNFRGATGYVLTLSELVSTNGDRIRKISNFNSANKSSVTYEVTKFPASLYAVFSDGQSINIELYKAATWKIWLYVNK